MRRQTTRRARRTSGTITPAQSKVMLNYLGIPFADMPSKVGDVKNMLAVFRRDHADKYEKAFNLVVRFQVEEGDGQEAINAAELGKFVSEHIDTYEGFALEQIRDEAKVRLAELSKSYEERSEQVKREAMEAAHRAINEATKKLVTVQIKVGNKKPKKIEGVVHEKFPRMIQLTSQRKNTLLVGPSGSGKTHVAGQIAEHLDLRFASQSCAVGVSESFFTGWLLPTGDGGKFEYHAAPLIDFYENGGVFLFDELDNSDPNVIVYVNQMLANDSFDLPLRFGNTKIKRSPNFVAIGAANTWGTGATAMYNARQQLDAATLDRFKLGQILVDYSPAIERQLVDHEVLEWGLKIREIIGRHNMRKIMSTRVMRDATDMKADCGWGIPEIEEGYFADWSPEEMRVVNHERTL